jgi:hypothetical protein
VSAAINNNMSQYLIKEIQMLKQEVALLKEQIKSLSKMGVSPSSGPTPKGPINPTPPIPVKDPKSPHHGTRILKPKTIPKKIEYPAKEQGYPRNETGLEQ